MNVTATHASVVTTTVAMVVFANTTNSAPLNGCRKWKYTAHASATSIAEISLHALIRHQYHRNKYTPPVPAPASSTNVHPARIVASSTDTSAAASTSSSVTILDTFT